MARIRLAGVSSDSQIPTPALGKSTLFYNDTDKSYKAKLDNGSVIVLSVTEEYLQDVIGALLQGSSTVFVNYDDNGNTISIEVIQAALNTSLIPNVPSGNLAATNVQDALDELQSDIDTRALDSDLTAHINNPTDAHDASAISVVPTGNLSSTDTQSALEELQLDIDNISINSEEVAQDAIGSAIALGTQDGVSVVYNDPANSLDFTNTDKGSVAVTAHEAALDPHPQYETSAEAQAKVDTHANLTNNPHGVTKTQVGLGDVDNTSDANKPVSTAQQTALNLKYDASNPNGYETPAQLNTRDTNNRARANHTGTQLASTISDFATTVLGTILTGLSLATGTVISATDTILVALGKLQKQISDNLTTLTNHIGSGGTAHPDATTSVAGFMSGADKTKLDGVTAGATNTPLATVAPVNVTKAAAVIGVSSEAARADHKHDVTTAAAVSLSPTTTNAEGAATTLARSNHTHAVATAAPVTNLTAVTTNATGTGTSFSRNDHSHAITTGAPSSIGTANAAGTSASLVRADHVHDHGAQTDATHHAVATVSANGFMSAADKTKLDGIGGARIIKSGAVNGTGFVGNPKTITVTFGTAFPNTNYSISLVGENSRTWTFESKVAGSFVINANANSAFTGDVLWTCISYGETVE